jgi:hypothetical protein
VLDVRTGLPPQASTSVILVSTLPQSWTGIRSPRGGIAVDSASPRQRRSPKAPSAWSPTWTRRSQPMEPRE